MDTNLDWINKYLWCGNLPPDEFPAWLSDCIIPETVGKDYSPQEAADRFDILFDTLVKQAPSERHIIPLSGGWDSRGILGALLERVDSDRITTVTFGVPGQLDYDLGKMVADSVGVEHHAFDLRSINFTWDAVRESVVACPWTHVPDSFFHSLIRNQFSNGSDIIWSGYLGDALTGSQPSDTSTSDEERDKNFTLKLRRSKSKLCSKKFNENDILKIQNQSKLTNLNHRDAIRIWEIYLIAFSEAPIVTPVQKFERWGAFIGREKNDAQVIAPFADSAWAGYWLSAPGDVRKGEKLYLDMLNLKFPEFFSLPGKANYGIRWDHGVRPMMRKGSYLLRSQVQRQVPWLGIRSSLMANYLDYDEMFRNREDYQATLRVAFEYLKENQVVPWLDLDALWEEHMRRRKDHGAAFCVLLGLAANCIENPFG